MRIHGRTAALAAAAGLVALLALPRPALAWPTANARLRSVRSWAFAIGDGQLAGNAAARLSRYDLVVVDGEEAPASLVKTLQATGTIVLAYLSVGTIEKGRWWYRSVKPYRLGWWGDWGEWYADTSKRSYRSVLVTRVAPWMLAKGFDGLFLDNTDMIAQHHAQARGMRYLVRDLSSLVHGRGRLLFAQNGADTIGPMVGYLDGWNREDVTWTYDFDSRTYVHEPRADTQAAQRELRSMWRRGLLALATDYTRDSDTAAARECGRNAWSAGALSFVSNIGLTRLP